MSTNFSLTQVESTITARLGVKPLRRSIRMADSNKTCKPFASYMEFVYPILPVYKISQAVDGLEVVQPVKANLGGFWSESGQWVNNHPDAHFRIKMRRYSGSFPSVRFMVTLIVTEPVKVEPVKVARRQRDEVLSLFMQMVEPWHTTTQVQGSLASLASFVQLV